MDAGSMTGTTKTGRSWKLSPEIAVQTQGLVVSGFGALPHGRALFVELGGGGGGWLAALEKVAPVTPAVPPGQNDPDGQQQATAIAFTGSGLARMGLPPTALASFSRPFREGMFQEDRLRRLGDRRRDQWLDTVLEGGPRWSANTPLHPVVEAKLGPLESPPGAAGARVTTPLTVHAVVLLYTREEGAAEALATAAAAAIEPFGVRVVHRLELELDVDSAGVSSEHFGFADGLSQPEPFDEGGAVTRGDAKALTGDGIHGVPLGDFLVGYINGHHERTAGPVVPGYIGGDRDQRPQQAGLSAHANAQSAYDFGLNGSYMVVRELKQDVAAFWRSMDENAAAILEREPEKSEHVTAEWLAERVVGRNRQGHVLCPGGVLPPGPDGRPDNSYLFQENDSHGIGCPPGSHVRRANPRDALAPNSGSGPTLLRAANNHRILRRGRKYGKRIADYRQDDGGDRGLLFICLNTDIARQFEFVQQTWLLNPDFATLFNEVDPLVGPDGMMTIREAPLRRSIHVETFVQMTGGDYFFLPSLPALHYLSLL